MFSMQFQKIFIPQPHYIINHDLNCGNQLQFFRNRSVKVSLSYFDMVRSWPVNGSGLAVSMVMKYADNIVKVNLSALSFELLHCK